MSDQIAIDGGTGDVATWYVGWTLSQADRGRLLEYFPPAFPGVIADHVTLCREDAAEASGLADREGLVIGRAIDPDGVEALLVEIDGTTLRADGGHYHLTWSIDADRGRKAFHSNAVIAERGWQPIEPPIVIALHVATWPVSRYP